MTASRRDLLGLALAGATAASAQAEPAGLPRPPSVPWARGIEGQRRADLGDGRFLNPIVPGDHPDPSILKDGDDYWMTHSSFDASPGLLIWHSRDLVNWTPVGAALDRPLGTVFAVDIAKHGDRFYIYIPFMKAPWSPDLPSFANIYVIHAPSMRGPWSAPIDLKIGGLIDPGHVVGEDGKRYLFLSGVNRVRLTDDGLATAGPVQPAYEGWRFPDDWVTEAYALEGPKLFRRAGWFYLVSAVGGTGGPATGHMVIAARSRSINGPWQNCPHNPIVRTRSDAEAWWSRGHATCVEGPGGRWYMVYHGYENGFRSLGRQTLLDPIVWDADGWFHATGGDLSRPLPMPAPTAGPAGLAASDDFRRPALGTRWSFNAGGPHEAERLAITDGVLRLQAHGSGPDDSPPLTQIVGDLAYQVSIEMEVDEGAQGGLLLFLDDRLFLGMGHDGKAMTTYRGGKVSYWREPAPAVRPMHLRIANHRQIVTFFYSVDGVTWTRHGVRSEVSGYNANTMDDLAGLRPALFAAGRGEVRFRNFRYEALA